MSRADEAARRHSAGYNCCQAVACAFADKIGVDEETLYKLTEGFGLGMGNMNGVCGAFSGAAMIAGFASSGGDIENSGKTKAVTYKKVAALQTEFTERAKRLICRDIKKGNEGKAFTPCDDCVRIAAELLEEFFK
jgi:C_GCAxxG_C_C family probable redox protein